MTNSVKETILKSIKITEGLTAQHKDTGYYLEIQSGGLITHLKMEDEASIDFVKRYLG